MPTTGLAPLAEVSLVLSADCNLRCPYCYQERHRRGVMPRRALRAAVDLLLASPSERRAVTFAGGEPMRAWPLVRRTVRDVSARAGGRRPVLHLLTNGLLLTSEHLAFLESHDVQLTLSVDGVAGAQDRRARGTFRRADALLDRLRSRHAAYLAERVGVSVTIDCRNVRYLSDSFRYFLAKDVKRVAVQPAMGQQEWADADLEEFDRQVGQIVEVSCEHWRAAREVPFAPFAGERRPRTRAWACSAPLGQSLAVDVDGQVYPCAVFARSYQAFPPGIDDRARMLSLGDVADANFSARLAQLPDACRQSGLFEPRRLHRSGSRRCAACRERSRCTVCPLARAKRPGPDLRDLNDVPRYLCACTRILGRHRRRFLGRIARPRGEHVLERLVAMRREDRGNGSSG